MADFLIVSCTVHSCFRQSFPQDQEDHWGKSQLIQGESDATSHQFSAGPHGQIIGDVDLPVLTDVHVFGLCEESGEPGENPHRHVENTLSPLRKVRGDEESQVLVGELNL